MAEPTPIRASENGQGDAEHIDPDLAENVIAISGKTYTIKPINVNRGIRLMNMTLHYLGRSSGVFQAFSTSQTDQDLPAMERFAPVLAEITKITDDDTSEELVTFLSLLSGIERDVLAEADAFELLEALPAVFKYSRYGDLLTKLFNQVTARLPAQETARTEPTQEAQETAAAAPTE